jgi:hypothetical protein
MAIHQTIGNGARVLLGSIRLINGAIGLLRPQLILQRLGAEDRQNPAGEYALRLFGIRTVLIGLDLLRPDGDTRARAVRVAPLIHASDTIAAGLAARSGLLSEGAGDTLVAISAANTGLALLMQWAEESEPSAHR